MTLVKANIVNATCPIIISMAWIPGSE